ncbi:recombinase family protein [Anaeromicropila herbilytica]|uniref:Recombinase domain-containing protein n=1 Tax=Anaeromicropila herbilytica TaxID=2785025 RepID=A0A7R7EP74_9FIRM|nr:recombinase family protein [Anaeromicropila herbilytica]BCN32165.1 hypothetical protein bsdtb5_34600 [Anaeromicropila herbilytica]
MERVAIYCRLSKEDIDKLKKGDDSGSIQNQKTLLLDYAKKQNWSVYDVFSDDDYSGTDQSRPEWNRMIKAAKMRKFDIVLCKTQSRFTREVVIVEQYIHTLFPIWNIRFISIVDHIDTKIKGNKKARQINALINEWYVEDLSLNVRTVYKQKMKVGEYLGAYAPYGYKKDSKNKYKLVVDEEAANVVKDIFNMALEGKSIKAICDSLTSKGIIPPSLYKLKGTYSNEQHLKWSTTTVNRILHNEMYLGDMVQHKAEKLDYKSKKIIAIPKKDWIIVRNTHDAIIQKELFDEVQRVLDKRKKR